MTRSRSGIGVGVIGLGVLGFGQAAMCRKIEGVLRVKGADPSEPARLRAERELGIEALPSWEPLVTDPGIQLLLVSSPNSAHVGPTVAALEAGKAVLLQKPMALSMDDCRRMALCAGRSGSFLQVGFECRYSLLYARMREVISSGEIGEVHDAGMEYCPGLWPIWLEHEGGWKYRRAHVGGMVLEKLSHYVDLIRWYVGRPVREVRTFVPKRVIPHFEIADNLRLALVFEGGATGAIHFSFTRSPASGQDSFSPGSAKEQHDFIDFSVTGAEGYMAFNRWFRKLQVIRYRNEDLFRPRLERSEDYARTDLARLMHDNHTELADVVRRVREGLEPFTPPDDSLETMRVCFAAEESADTGRSVFLDAESERRGEHGLRRPVARPGDGPDEVYLRR